MAIQQQRNMTPEELSFFNRPENKPVRNPMDAALAMPVAQGGGMFPQILQGAQQLQQQQLGHGGGRSVKLDAYGRPRDFNAPVGLNWLEANGPGRASVQQRYAAMMPEDINAKAERGRQAVEAMKMLQGQQNDSVGPARWMGDGAGTLRTGMKDGQMVGFGTDTPQLAGLHQTPDHLPQRGGQMMTPVQTAIDQAGMAFFGPGEQMQPQQQAPAQAQPQAQAVPARQTAPQPSSPNQAVLGLTPDAPWQNFMPQEQQAQSPLDAVLGATPQADWTSFMPQGPQPVQPQNPIDTVTGLSPQADWNAFLPQEGKAQPNANVDLSPLPYIQSLLQKHGPSVLDFFNRQPGAQHGSVQTSAQTNPGAVDMVGRLLFGGFYPQAQASVQPPASPSPQSGIDQSLGWLKQKHAAGSQAGWNMTKTGAEALINGASALGQGWMDSMQPINDFRDWALFGEPYQSWGQRKAQEYQQRKATLGY